MGSFSYTCQLSGLPITAGDRCLILPIIPKDHWGYDSSQKSLTKFGQGSLVSNDGANLYFDELCFPIFGTYNDYGGLEDIEKDDNTKVLEHYFGLPIEKIVDCILDGRKDSWFVDDDQFKFSALTDTIDLTKNKNQILLVRASATWLRADLYEKLANTTLGKDHYDKIDLGVHGLLKSIGFELINEHKENNKTRYYKEYKKGNVTVYSDGNWLSDKKGESNNMNVYTLRVLKKWCNERGEDIDITPFNNSTYYSQVYDCILPNIDKLKGGDRWNSERVFRMLFGDEYKINRLFAEEIDFKKIIKELKEKNPERYEEVKDLFDEEDEDENPTDSKDVKPTEYLPQVYFDFIKKEGSPFLRKNIIEWFKVKKYYYTTGRFLYPIGTSPQDGDIDSYNILVSAAKECAMSEIEQRVLDGYYEEELEEED